jgi:hypothetical protein
MKVLVATLLALAVGCGSDADPVALTFVTPQAGDAVTRDQLDTATGELVARVAVEVDIQGAPARVGLVAGSVATDLVDGAATLDLATPGTVTLVATAYDDADAELATATVDVAIGEAMPASCRDALALYQIEFTAGPERQGVEDPVTATVPINGVSYRVLGNAEPRETMFADCTLILSLAKAAPIMRARAVVEVADLGVYNFRCIGGGTPPNCPNGISQHAFATAIDIAGVTDTTGEFASVNDDWVIDPNSEETCEAATEPGKDRQLHELICALKAANVWTIVLTPNYNADHRNHFHVDLTPDADFIEKRSL